MIIKHETAPNVYVSDVYWGKRQSMKALIDTATDLVAVRSKDCADCGGENKYDSTTDF